MSGKRDFTRCRSAGYQDRFLEAACSPELLTEFAERDSMGGRMNNSVYSEELLDLQEQLRQEYWKIIDTQLTERQREVLKLTAAGDTQVEIAKKLGVNQSSVTKSIFGNTDYRPTLEGLPSKRIYGGSSKRLKKLASTNETIQILLKKIAEISDDTW